MKKYFFFSYCIQTCALGKSNTFTNVFRNGVSENHPLTAIHAISNEEAISIPHVVKTEIVLMHWREISETEYLLFKN
jgi:hypothetical protein